MIRMVLKPLASPEQPKGSRTLKVVKDGCQRLMAEGMDGKTVKETYGYQLDRVEQQELAQLARLMVGHIGMCNLLEVRVEMFTQEEE